jgi:putative transposase
MFLSSQVKELVALDFFVVPTVTYKVLFVLLMLSHHRRRVAHVKVTAHPTAEWTAQPLVEEFPCSRHACSGSTGHIQSHLCWAGSR